MSEKQIFFHTGLSKTGSTFLQRQVFPFLKGIKYIPTVKFRCVDKYISNCNESKIIVSREFDQQFEKEVKKFAAKYPNAYPIIVFREHGNWIVSQYKRFVKNGHPYTFNEFINLQENNGRFKAEDLNFKSKLDLLNTCFKNKPLVLLFDDLRENPREYIQRLLDYTGTHVNWDEIDFSPNHKSYNEHSLKLVRKVSNWLPFQKKLEIQGNPLGFIYNLYANFVRYTLLYGSKLVPESIFSNEQFIESDKIIDLREHCKEDWNFIQSYCREPVNEGTS